MISAWLFLVLLAEALPTTQVLPQQDPEAVASAGTGAFGRLLYGIISTICLCALSFALGLRVKQFETKKRLQFSWVVSHVQTLLAMILVVAGAILVYGLNLTNYKQCRAAITVCLFLYFSSKVLLYIFYLERIHIARLPIAQDRRNDKIWVGGMVMIVGFFGGMAIWCIATPHAAFSLHDGDCHIGSDMIPSYITFASDIIINIGLTGIFVSLLLPVLTNQNRRSVTMIDETPPLRARNRFSLREALSSHANDGDQLALSVKKMLWRNIIGSVLTFVAGSINLIFYFIDATSQVAYVCYTLCIVDVVFGVLVVQWLTLGTKQPDTNSTPQPAVANFNGSAAAFTSLSVPDAVVIQHKPSL
ncbi:hypothetical protein ACEQ8H_000652 [Pleosporales sp. CAS-2024a]